jgi:rhodanese-related sulfurtransferase
MFDTNNKMSFLNISLVFAVITGILFSSVLSLSFAGEAKDILSVEAYDMLNTVPDTYLIDVRTRAEYQFVGHPINAYLFPYMFMSNALVNADSRIFYRFDIKNTAFVQEIGKFFKKDDNLLIISRDGIRSALAAAELVRAGYKNIYNVRDGFEGPYFPDFADKDRNKFYRQLARRNNIHGYNHRRHYGWQWWGLPWTYHMDKRFLYPPDLAEIKQ